MRDHDLPFPFNIRRTLGLWKLLFLDGEPFKPDPSKSPQWNRGAYLVNGPGHCAECHSPRNALGAIIVGHAFHRRAEPDGQGGVPNITQFKLKDWSVKDIADTLETGMTPDADRVGGSMIEVGAQYLATDRGRPRGDGDLHQVAAAGRRLRAQEEIVAVRHSATRALARGSANDEG